jgi:16S rRNA (guanine(966)-N(2))-methyltransferase RsmD
MTRNRVRIIGGAWRSRLVQFAPRPDLRPTPDRVRETLFNWLGQDLGGKTCLDLFAGSGALGFEAASRRAVRVVMVERDPVVFQALMASRAALDAAVVELRRADALEFLRTDGDVYDVVFVDPPYRSDLWPQVALLLPRHLAPGALVYLERPGRTGPLPGWEVWRQGRAGQVAYQLLKRSEGALP